MAGIFDVIFVGWIAGWIMEIGRGYFETFGLDDDDADGTVVAEMELLTIGGGAVGTTEDIELTLG